MSLLKMFGSGVATAVPTGDKGVFIFIGVLVVAVAAIVVATVFLGKKKK